MTHAPTSKPGKTPLDAGDLVEKQRAAPAKEKVAANKTKAAKKKAAAPRKGRAKATSEAFPLAGDPRVVEVEVADALPAPPADSAAERPPRCPVTPLGAQDGVYFVLSSRGELRVLGFAQMRRQGMTSLFGGDMAWPVAVCGTFDKDGAPTGGWNEDKLMRRLMRDCEAAGFCDLQHDVRKAGVWRLAGSGDPVQLVIHCGDKVLLPAELAPPERLIGPAASPPGYAWARAGFKLGSMVYPVSPAMPPPADRPCDAAVIHELYELLKSWNWRDPAVAPLLILGHIGCAIMCGALGWRPHTWVCGQPVSGKSYMEQLVSGIVGRMAYRVTDPTEAGLRQGLDGAARPCFLDEINTDGDAERVRAVVKVVKIASTDNQAPVVRGSAEGRAKTFLIRTVAYLTSKTHIRLRADDSSRITVLDLDKFVPERDADKARRTIATLKVDVARFVALGPAIRARAIAQYPVFVANLDVLRGVLAERGQTSRQVDQLGTQLAYAEALLNDDVIDEIGARELVETFELQELTGFADEDDPFQCWDHLMTSTIDVRRHEGGIERMAIGEVLQTVEPDQTDGPAAEALRRHGIVVRNHQIGSDTVVCIVVANTSAKLEELFRGTGFDDGRWKILAKLPNALRGKQAKQVKFAGRPMRCVWIPESPEVFQFDRDTADDEKEGDDGAI